MRKTLIFAAAIALPMAAAPALADDHTAEQPELLDQNWHRVNFVRFHEGKQGRASEIIAMFEQADEKIGRTSPILIHMNTGPWHMIGAFPLENGIAEMGWTQTADDKAWRDAFAEIAGGQDQARALWEEFSSLIAERQRHIGHTH
ncbi:hypothetical protein [Erythrobacter rubeus]|uniref:NIPSNAP domain-containing protein n=1 Tax=Erythrobacter rubeus TaxID=2760803 RepID=A0ABR8KN74_9SPHN|nr:hypothetical protein [Erythrobacter rubeus]MBD2842072.1 hypothetical protein [Erythrobacter rubeus]